MYRITRIMTVENGKHCTKKINPIICDEHYLKLYRILFTFSDSKFKGFVIKNIIDKEDLKGYYYCKG